jgi:hypothetical protein
VNCSKEEKRRTVSGRGIDSETLKEDEKFHFQNKTGG